MTTATIEMPATENAAKPERTKRRRRFGRIYSRKWASGRRTWAAVWFCRVERRRLTRSFDCEKDAREFLGELEKRKLAAVYEVPPTIAEATREDEEAAAASRAPEKPPIPALVAYAEHVLTTRFAPVLAAGTIGVYRAALRAWRDHFGERTLDAITPAAWAEYRAWRATARHSTHGETTKPVGPRTLNADLQCLVRILNEAVLDAHLAANPLAGTKKLREPKRPRRYLSLDEIERLLANCPKRFKPLLTTAIFTGCRKSELVAIRWHDVDLDGRKLTIYRSKTGTSDRLDLHPVVAKELERMKRKRPDATGEDHVFLSTHGTAFVDVRKSWNAALRAAGIEQRPGLTFHTTRHSFSCWFLSNGGAVTDLMAQLGHQKLETTQIYAAAVSERRRATVMALPFGGTRKRRGTKPPAADDTTESVAAAS
ncbi:MAG: site-specific integrase [Planctomycetes bacterium]|nr:site-specific integrase [Planctomycetota bacterium]